VNTPTHARLAEALAALGLRPDADARAARRAYAQQLKQIDQATQLQDFQALREAYEFALGGIAWRDAQALQPEPAEAPAAEPAGPAPSPHAGFTPPDGPALAEAVFAGFAERAGAGFKDETEAFEALQAALADDRLLNLEARTIFEAHVAHLIMRGWQPGHEFLFGTACAAFNWERDRAHLRVFGQLGAALDAAINEKLIFFQQSSGDFELQRSAIRRLRQTEMPSVALRRADMPLVQMLVQRYPNWLRLITSQANINTWFSNLPPEPESPAAVSAAAPVPRAEPTLRRGWRPASTLKPWFIAVFVLFMLAKLFTASPPARTQLSDSDMARLRAPVQSGPPISTWPPPKPSQGDPYGFGAPSQKPLYDLVPPSGELVPGRARKAAPTPAPDVGLSAPVQFVFIDDVTFMRRGGQVLVDEVGERNRRGTSPLRPGDRLEGCANADDRVPLIFLAERGRCGITKSVNTRSGATTYTFRVLRDGRSLTASLVAQPSPGEAAALAAKSTQQARTAK
jgi:protein TonB